jgi:hypothetical protein
MRYAIDRSPLVLDVARLRGLFGLMAWLVVGPAGCLPDDPVDDNNPFTDDDDDDDDDDYHQTQPEDCPVWAPEYKVGYRREYFVQDDTDRNATYLGLQDWQGGVYWTDEVFAVDAGAIEAYVYDHCQDGKLYRIGTEDPSGGFTLFNPPVLQLDDDLSDGSVWTSEYNLLFRHFTERYEVVGPETIEIGAGTFEALHIEMRLSFFEDDQPVEIWWDNYYVEEIGLALQSSTTPTYFELMAYEMPDQWQ